MKLKDRILSDSRGFVASTEVEEDKNLRSVNIALTKKVMDLEKKLKDRDKHWENQRSIELIGAKDRLSALEKKNKKLEQDMDLMKGREAQLLKEISDMNGVLSKPKGLTKKKSK